MNFSLGVFVAILAGTMNGLFPLPMKGNRVWAWENTWLPFSALSLAVFPWIIAWSVIPELKAACFHIQASDRWIAFAWGLLIYTGSLLFGISLDLIGMGLAFSLLIGTMTAVGVLGPWMLHGANNAVASNYLVAGVCLSLISVVLGALAARSRGATSTSVNASPVRGTVLAVLGGVLSGFLPIAMSTSCAERIRSAALHYGNALPANASNLMLAFILLGGFMTNSAYCFFLLVKHRTAGRFIEYSRAKYWMIVLAMALLYSCSNALWGISISPRLLGPSGPSIGWALFVGTIVLASTASGLISGEWAGADRRSIWRLVASVFVLITGMSLICCAIH